MAALTDEIGDPLGAKIDYYVSVDLEGRGFFFLSSHNHYK